MWNDIFSDDEEDRVPLSPRRTEALPDEIILLGADAEKRMLPLQVDSDGRLVVQPASPVYLGALATPMPYSNADLWDEDSVVIGALFTNSYSVAQTAYLTIGGYDFFRCTVPPNESVYYEFCLAVSEAQPLRGRCRPNGNTVKLLVCAHTGEDLLR